ncbi:hypothetical protein Drose_04095 [Dactylosporangium roseum]|uniref:Uncharacterized protein n=1 Tax=Dactylosporangium roseum TaxID=47989 RepID=A0ABY5Z8Y3_9ACTN|nr:hypothetical protein [Dactylosporangium roseum]UWZ37470.1 hypothetical protein Drose_04095 [Dactylosporangium roseum]
MYAHTTDKALEMIEQRGPRFAVIGNIRRGQSMVSYADTGEQAERIRETFVESSYYQIKVHPPVGSVDLAGLGRDRSDAKAAYDEATAILRAGVLRALEEGREETEVARTAGVDRQTVRAWAGKQPMNRG